MFHRMQTLTLVVVAALAALPAVAQEGGALTLGGDRYGGAARIAQTEPVAGDLFLAGESARSAAAVEGSAHMAARRVTVAAPVGGNLYAAGMDVTVEAQIGGSATLAGYEVTVSGAIGRNLRAAGQQVGVLAPVAGAVLVAAEEVLLDAAVGGDARLVFDRVEFGPGATVGGILTLVAEDPDAIAVPPGVAPPGRIRREIARRMPAADMPMPEVPWSRVVLGVLGTIVALGLLTAALALVAPRGMAGLRRRVADAPLRAVGLGFLALSALTGSVLVVALTLVGLVLSPAALLLALVAGVAGYLVGLYALGAGVLVSLGRGEPERAGERLVAAFLGAGLAGLIALVPFLGWLFVLALTLAGLGALTARLVRPAFFT